MIKYFTPKRVCSGPKMCPQGLLNSLMPPKLLKFVMPAGFFTINGPFSCQKYLGSLVWEMRCHWQVFKITFYSTAMSTRL